MVSAPIHSAWNSWHKYTRAPAPNSWQWSNSWEFLSITLGHSQAEGTRTSLNEDILTGSNKRSRSTLEHASLSNYYNDFIPNEGLRKAQRCSQTWFHSQVLPALLPSIPPVSFLRARVASINEVRLQWPIRKAHESSRQIWVMLTHLCQLSLWRMPLVKHQCFLFCESVCKIGTRELRIVKTLKKKRIGKTKDFRSCYRHPRKCLHSLVQRSLQNSCRESNFLLWRIAQIQLHAVENCMKFSVIPKKDKLVEINYKTPYRKIGFFRKIIIIIIIIQISPRQLFSEVKSSQAIIINT